MDWAADIKRCDSLIVWFALRAMAPQLAAGRIEFKSTGHRCEYSIVIRFHN